MNKRQAWLVIVLLAVAIYYVVILLVALITGQPLFMWGFLLPPLLVACLIVRAVVLGCMDYFRDIPQMERDFNRNATYGSLGE